MKKFFVQQFEKYLLPERSTAGSLTADAMLQRWRDRTVLLALTVILVAALPTLAVMWVRSWDAPEQRPLIALFLLLYLLTFVLRYVKPLSPRVRSWGFLGLVYVAGVLSLIRGGLVGVGKDYVLVLPLLAVLFRGRRAGLMAIPLCFLTYLVVGILLNQGYLTPMILYPEAVVDMSIWVSEGVYLTLLLSVFFVLMVTFSNFLLQALGVQLQTAAELERLNQALSLHSQTLEEQVAARTEELSQVNVQLREQIAERLRAEQGLRFRATLLEQLPDLIVAINMDRYVTYLNSAAANFFACDPAAIVHQPITALQLHGQEGVSWDTIIQTTLSQGEWQGLWNHRLATGEVLNLHVRAWVIKDPRGQSEGIITIMSDVTERVKSEALLQRHNRELTLLNRLIAAAAAIADIRHLLEIMCRDLAQFFDLPQAMALTLDAFNDRAVVVAEYLAPDRPSFLDLTFQISTNPALRYMLNFHQPLFITDIQADRSLGDLTELLLGRGVKSVLLVPLVIRGRVISILCFDLVGRMAFEELDMILVKSVASAVSQTLEAAELRIAIEKTQAADRAKSQFIHHVSHELRTPLTNIRTYLDLTRLGLKERRDEYIAVALAEAVRLQHLIEDLLYLSKLDLGQLEVKVQPLDVNRLVEDLVHERARFFLAQGLELLLETDPQLPEVMADERALRQILHSLLTNALHFTPSGGQVLLKTALTAGEGRAWGTIEVRDTGLGMSEAEQLQLFQRFQRGTAVELTNVPGTGVGLALSKELVELQRGRLTVKSRLQEGSTFTIWLPLA